MTTECRGRRNWTRRKEILFSRLKSKKALVFGMLLFAIVLLITSGILFLPERSAPSEVKIISTYTEPIDPERFPGEGYVCVTVKNFGNEPCSFVVKIYDAEWEGWRKSDPQIIQPGEEKTIKFGGDFVFFDLSSATVETFSAERDSLGSIPLSIFLMIVGLGALVITAKIDRELAGKCMLAAGLLLWIPGVPITWTLAAIWRIGGSTEVWFSGMERAEPGIIVPNLILVPMVLGLVFLSAGLILYTTPHVISEKYGGRMRLQKITELDTEYWDKREAGLLHRTRRELHT